VCRFFGYLFTRAADDYPSMHKVELGFLFYPLLYILLYLHVSASGLAILFACRDQLFEWLSLLASTVRALDRALTK